MFEITIFDLIKAIFKYFKKYYKIFILAFVIGLIAGIIDSRKATISYRAIIYARTGLLQTTALKYDLGSVMLDLSNLKNKIFKSDNPREQIEYYLNIPNSTLLNFNVDIKDFPYGISPVIQLTVYLKDTSELNAIKQGFIYYFEHHSPLINIYKRQQAFLKDSIQNAFKRFYQEISKQSTNKNVIINFSNIFTQDVYIYNYTYPLFYYVSDFSNVILSGGGKIYKSEYAFALLIITIILTSLYEIFAFFKKRVEQNEKS